MSTSLLPGTIRRDARLSIFSDATYRWWLSRHWGPEGEESQAMVFVMLNPSIADHTTDDATVRKCMGFAAHHKCNTIAIANLFSLVSSDPGELVTAKDPVGGGRADTHLDYAVKIATHPLSTLVVAWGSQPRIRDAMQARIDLLWGMCLGHGVRPLCLGTTKDGSPRHPSRLAYDSPLTPWRPPGR